MIARPNPAARRRASWGSTSDGPDGAQVRFAAEDLRGLRAAFRLAPQVGGGLGSGAPLLRQMPPGAQGERLRQGARIPCDLGPMTPDLQACALMQGGDSHAVA